MRGSSSLIAVALAVVTLAVYWPVTGHEFVNYDDNLYVTDNPHVRAGLTPGSIAWALTTSHCVNWHPLTWISHMLDAQLFGMSAGGHHATSVLFHVVNSVLLFMALTRMTRAPWHSAFVAALFALHPLHVESVAWVAERKDVLSAFFWMLAMLAYVQYVERPAAMRLALVGLALAAGLMAKPMLVTLPFTLLLLDYWPLRRCGQRPADRVSRGPGQEERRWRPDIRAWVHLLREKVPLFVLVGIASAVTLLIQRAGGAVVPEGSFPMAVRVTNAVVSYATYIAKAIWPSRLAVFYPHPMDTAPMWQVAGAAAALCLVSVYALVSLRRRPYVAVGWLWYVGTLVPVIGLVQVGEQAMADRYTYIPLIGLFVIVSWGVPELLSGWRHAGTIAGVGATVVLMALGIRTVEQIRYWKDSISLFEHAVAVTEGNWLAHENLGFALVSAGRYEEGIRQYLETVRIRPSYANIRNSLGVVLAQEGRLGEAVSYYAEALRLRPEYPEAHNNLGAALAQKGHLDEAIAHFSEALRLEPDFIDARHNLHIALGAKSRMDRRTAEESGTSFSEHVP